MNPPLPPLDLGFINLVRNSGIDLGQNDGDDNLPKGWGFKLKTVGALIFRGAIRSATENSNNSQPSAPFPNYQEQEKEQDQKIRK